MAPSSRKRKNDAEEDNGFHSAATKKSKTSAPELKEDDDGNPYWEISGKRRLQITTFKSMTMVGIREFYEKDGKSLPGKAGISLPLDQFRAVLNSLPAVVRALQKRGEEVRVPDFGGADENGDDEGEKGEDERKEEGGRSLKKKANFEATSEEDEGD